MVQMNDHIEFCSLSLRFWNFLCLCRKLSTS